MVDVDLALTELLMLSRPSTGYCRENGIDFAATVSHCDGVHLAPVTLVPPRFFDPNPAGAMAAWCTVLDEDGETAIDAVAWSLRDPTRFRTMFGRAPALGLAVAANPATYFGDTPLRLYRTPLAWLQAGCQGAVVLDRERGARWLIDVPSSAFAAEDDEHAREIARARSEIVERQKIVVPAKPTPLRIMEAA